MSTPKAVPETTAIRRAAEIVAKLREARAARATSRFLREMDSSRAASDLANGPAGDLILSAAAGTTGSADAASLADAVATLRRDVDKLMAGAETPTTWIEGRAAHYAARPNDRRDPLAQPCPTAGAAPAGLADEMDRRMGEDGPEAIADVLARLGTIGRPLYGGGDTGGMKTPFLASLDRHGYGHGRRIEVTSDSRDGAWRALDAECERRGLYPDPEPSASAFLATIADVLDDAAAAGDTGVEPVAPGGFPTPRMGGARPTIAEIHADLESLGGLCTRRIGDGWSADVSGRGGVGIGMTPEAAERALHATLFARGVIPAGRINFFGSTLPLALAKHGIVVEATP